MPKGTDVSGMAAGVQHQMNTLVGAKLGGRLAAMESGSAEQQEETVRFTCRFVPVHVCMCLLSFSSLMGLGGCT